MTSKLDINYLDPLALQPDVMLLANYNDGGIGSGGRTITIGVQDNRNIKGGLTNFALYVQLAKASFSPTDSTPSGWTKIFTNTSNSGGSYVRVSVFYKTGTITSNVTGGLVGDGFGGSIAKLYLFNIKNLTPTVTVEDFDSSGTTPTPASQDFVYTGGNPSLGFAVKGVFSSQDATITSDITPKYSDESTVGTAGSYGTLRVSLYPYNSNAPTINISSSTDDASVELLGGGYVSFS